VRISRSLMPIGSSRLIRLPSQTVPPWGSMASPYNVMIRELARIGVCS
jgi:hypothetical protein